MSKKSIRFFNDREVRAVWDEENSKWWFSATDIVRAINDEEDYVKAGNYWRWLKKKLNADGVQLVSVTHDFKFQAPDGKQRAADALDSDCVRTLAENYPNNRANTFLNWFVYSDNSIDGQSKKKAYTLIESGLLETMRPGSVKCLQQIHAYLFGGLYDFAGKIRMKTIWKDGTLFCRAEYLMQNLRLIEQMPQTNFDEIVDKYVEMNMALDWSKISKKDYLEAMRRSTTDAKPIRHLLRQAMTDRIDDREIFMKGIDYSYYYEQEN